MIITDPIKEFYAPLLHERVLVLVAMDVDALCASRVLQTLFQIDHVRLVASWVDTTDDKSQHCSLLFIVAQINVFTKIQHCSR